MKTLLRSSLVAVLLFGGYSAFSLKANSTNATAFGTTPTTGGLPRPDCICTPAPQPTN